MEPVEEGFTYHIYNRGAGKNDLFFSEMDYHDFLSKYIYYLYISAETYAYCVLRNHFHVLIRVRTIDEQEEIFSSVKEKFPEGTFYGDCFDAPKPFLASKQFSHLMNSYTKSLNSRNNRTGTLVEGTFKRKKVIDERHFNHLTCYIHRNPIHHGIIKDYSEYRFSSYNMILSERNTFLERAKLITQFGGKQNFTEAHKEFKMMLSEEYYLE